MTTVTTVRDRFKVRNDLATWCGDLLHVRYVEAEAGTGSRYAVTATRLPTGHGEGAGVLVTVTAPRNAAWPITWGSFLMDYYVAEKFAPRGREVSEADVAALAMTIAVAIDGTSEHD
jgi:hypothetical protein